MDLKKRPPTNNLGLGESLGVDEYLIMKSNLPRQVEISHRFKLDWQWQFRLDKIDETGNIVLPMWAEGPDDQFSNRWVSMQDDGNLVVQSDVQWAKWESNTGSPQNAGSSLILGGDGNAAIIRKNGTIAWQTNTAELVPIFKKDRLQFNEQLSAEQCLVSPNGNHKFIAQKDGNLVVYGPSGVKWASGTQSRYRDRDGYRMILGDDDNLCWYQMGGGLRWNSDTRRRKKGGRGALIMRDDGLLVLKSDNTIIWCQDRSKIQPFEPLEVRLHLTK